MQVSHTQALNMLESQTMTGLIVQKLTPIHMADQCVVQPGSNAALTQEQPVTPVSFASTTQVRMDTAIPPPASQVPPPGYAHMVTLIANHKCSKHLKYGTIFNVTPNRDDSHVSRSAMDLSHSVGNVERGTTNYTML